MWFQMVNGVHLFISVSTSFGVCPKDCTSMSHVSSCSEALSTIRAGLQMPKYSGGVLNFKTSKMYFSCTFMGLLYDKKSWCVWLAKCSVLLWLNAVFSLWTERLTHWGIIHLFTFSTTEDVCCSALPRKSHPLSKRFQIRYGSASWSICTETGLFLACEITPVG